MLCIDEKSQTEALDCTPASLPMKKGRAPAMTHDYKRNATTTLFAALDVLTGKLDDKAIRRSIFQSVPDLITAINAITN